MPLPGVPFDEKSGVVPNHRGRVIDADSQEVVPGQYVVGWIKRGPTGLLGTNKRDSAETVNAMLEDIEGTIVPMYSEKKPEAIEPFLKSKNIPYLTFSDWKKLDALEVEKGEALGKVRQKFVRLPDMFKALAKE